MADPNQPQPYQLPPEYRPPATPRGGLPTWAIILIVAGALLTVMCVVGAIVSIGVLTLLGSRVSQVFSEINSGLEEQQPPAPPVVDTSAAVPIGDAVALPDLRITVTDAHPLTKIREGREPAPGEQYWAVEVTFENTSDRSLTLSAFSSSLQDEAGTEYIYSTPAQRASPDPGLPVVQPLQPGKSASGTLFYMVPEDARTLFWVYNNVGGGGQAVVAIKEEPR